MRDKRQLIEIDKHNHIFTQNALDYLGKQGIDKIKHLYKDTTSNNWLMAEVKDNYFISLANVEGCKSTVFGSIEHTMSIFTIACLKFKSSNSEEITKAEKIELCRK